MSLNKDNVKQIIISILIGACVAFFSTLFDGLAEFMKANSTQIMSGVSATMYHMAKTYRV